jgi:uncharacterized membrane protein YhaH (DUF805 family)
VIDAPICVFGAQEGIGGNAGPRKWRITRKYTLTTLYGLAILIPSLAVGVRRLHDTDRSGRLMLIGVIPIVGAIVLLIFLTQDSQLMDNHYGPNPKGEITAYQRYAVKQP